MRNDKRYGLRNRFSQTISKFFNIFTFCSRQSTSYIIKNPSFSNTFILSTPAIQRRNIYLSNRFELTFYSTSFTSLDQTRQNKPVSSSSSSSSIVNCQSSLTIHQCCSPNIISSNPPTNNVMYNNSSNIIEKSPSLSIPPTSSHFSYLIRPTTPCIFGRETYDDEQMNDDEFFLTAGGIVHSCPNIYELSIDNHRKLQSCDHLIFVDQQTTLINNTHLNCYDTEFDRYSIVPRFQPISPSISTDSINSELELYKERHAIGLCRQYHDNTSAYSSFLPTTWKSDNYLLFMPFIQHPHSSLFNSIDHGKRSRSHDISIEQTCTSTIA